MLHRLCEPPSIPLSFSLATILPRRGTSRFPYGREPIGEPPTQCPSLTARTTGGSNPLRRVKPGDSGGRRPDPPTRALSPVIPNNVRTVRLTAAAGTNLARASSRDRSTRRLPPPRQEFTTRRPSSSTRRRSVRLAPIAEDSRLQPPVGVWAVSQSQWWGSRSHAPYPSKPW